MSKKKDIVIDADFIHIVPTNLLPTTLKYPTGKKDGNKLGLRKRKLRYTQNLKVFDTLFVPTETYKKMMENEI